MIHDVESKDQVSVGHFFSKSNITSDWKRKIEIKLFIQSAFAGGSHLTGIIRIHLMIYFLECTILIAQITKELHGLESTRPNSDQARRHWPSASWSQTTGKGRPSLVLSAP